MKKSDKMRLLLESLKKTNFFPKKLKNKTDKNEEKQQFKEEKQEISETKVIRKKIVKKRFN
jgi:hypothetical protein